MSIKLPDKWKKILSKIASKDKLLIFLLAGVLLIIINIPVKSSTAKAKNSDTTVKETQADSSYYISALEKELSQALAECEGVGRAKVVITAANNGKSVLYVQKSESENITDETDSTGGNRRTSQKTSDESVVYTDSGSTKSPFITEELVPEIQGVLILAEGGDDARTVSEITKAASALLGISVNKIKVLKMEV